MTKLLRSGKVRDIYEVSDTELVIVTTDRISAFDRVLKPEVPDRGRILQAVSLFWADKLDVQYHLASRPGEIDDALPEPFKSDPAFKGRSMLVEKAEVIPFECVVRSFLCGSAWKDYQKTGAICGIKLPPGLKQNMPLPKPIFTPATKAETGHDENVSYETLEKVLGIELASWLEATSLEIFEIGAKHCWERGLILADTKFEFGLLKHMGDERVLIDEVMTPDSSRYWPVDKYWLSTSIRSFDKQFVRDYLEKSGWDKESDPPTLPARVIDKTRFKYIEAYERITEKVWE